MMWLLAAVAVIFLSVMAPRLIGCLVTILAGAAVFLAALGYYMTGGLDNRLDFGGAMLLGLAAAVAAMWLGYQMLVHRRR